MTPRRLDAVTFGEVMVMFVADEAGPLEKVSRFTRAMAGAETNVATGLARLGHASGWVGRVGDDPFGRFARAELTREGVDTTAVTTDHEAPTGFQLKSRADGTDPEVVYFRRDSAGSRLTTTPLSTAQVAASRHLHTTGIPLALSPTARAFAVDAIRTARSAGATVSFDPNLRPSLWPSQEKMVETINAIAVTSDWVMPGLEEGRILLGDPDADADAIARFYLRQGVTRVVVKAGPGGATMYSRDAGRCDQPVFPVEVADTVGAGDGFAVGLISGHLDGLSLPAALERAAAVGALAVTSSGDKDGLPRRDQLNRFIADHATKKHGGAPHRKDGPTPASHPDNDPTR